MSKTSLFLGIRAVGRRARLGRSNVCNIITRNRLLLPTHASASGSDVQQRFKSNGNGDKDLSSIIQPIPVKPCNDPDGINVGAELTGSLKKEDLLRTINNFYRLPEVKQLAAENGLDNKLFHEAYVSFRRFCIESEALPVDLHIVFSDILQEAVSYVRRGDVSFEQQPHGMRSLWQASPFIPRPVGTLVTSHVNDIFPYFMEHAKLIFPHLDCMEDLRKISDLRLPANWYPEARAMHRKIIYHAGPTNSGKTHHALERFLSAKSGVYCGPLRLLANEVFTKANDLGTPCDLITGEERRLVSPDKEPSNHVACTVEMTGVNIPYEVAVLDEIQMLRDTGRGWAWTRAFLGVCAQEVHLCGEASAIELVREFAHTVGDDFEVRRYKRLTPLTVMDKAIEKFDNIRPGDCIVCFSKNDVYHCSRQLEKRGQQVAVIYGGLPPGTKVAQAQKFNDPDDPCKVMVSTDAIGMGINLNIKRIVFYSLVKPTVNERGEKEIDVIPPSTALQIAGRAGRFGTTWEDGEVTTFKGADLQQLKKLLNTSIEPIKQAGLHPTAEQIELFAYHLPKATLCNLIDIFVTLSQLDNDRYFMCNVEDFKFLADMIEHVPLPLRTRYVFCCAPIPKKQPFVCTMFLKFSRRFSRGEPLTLDWLCRQIGWPFSAPKNLQDLVHLEGVFDVLDLYLWLSYRFPDMLPDMEHVRDMQRELDALIQEGVVCLTNLLKNSENAVSNMDPNDDDDFQVSSRSERANRSARQHGIPRLDEENDNQFQYPQQPKKRMESLRARFERAKLDNHPDTAELPPVKRQSLTDQLIARGLLTPAMVRQLQQELAGQAPDEPPSPKHGSKSNGKKKKK